MKKIACLALVGALGLFGCGGGGSGDDDDDDIVFPDASINPGDPDAAVGECNTVSQTGCPDGQKCSYIVDQLDPEIGHIGCTDAGGDALGAPCTDAAVAGTSDSCVAGGYCYNGTCREICSTLNDQCDGECGDFVDGNGNPFPIEWCLFSCDPLTQDCATENEACFLSSGAGICLRHDVVAVGEPCQFTNSCDEGSQCFGDPGVCRQLCGAIDQIWGDDGADPPLLTWPTCCGTNCGSATLPCGLPNDMCWIVSDGTPDGIANIGICLDDEEASGGTAPDTWTCDCNSVAAEKCALDNPE